MDIFSHSTQICGEYAFDSPQGQARADGNQGLAQRDFASMDFLKRRMHGQISSIKTAIFIFLPSGRFRRPNGEKTPSSGFNTSRKTLLINTSDLTISFSSHRIFS
jgi:hypothetical protein